MSTATNDTNAGLPRQVRAQLAKAQSIIESRTAPQSTATGTDPATAQSGENGNGGTPNGQAPTASPGTAPAAAPAASDPRESDPAYWRQRWSVTDGMLKASQKRHADERLASEQTIAELRRELAAEKSKASTSNGPDISSVFTPEQIEALGEDQCRAILIGAQTVAKKQVDEALAQHVVPAQQTSAAQRANEAREREDAFFDKLTELVPEWEATNQRQDFLVWLADLDAGTGLVRDEVLKAHRARLNAAGAAKVFTDFLASLQRPQPPVAAPAPATPAATHPASPAQGAPTRAEINDFFKRSALGKVTDPERAAFEARLRSMQQAA